MPSIARSATRDRQHLSTESVGSIVANGDRTPGPRRQLGSHHKICGDSQDILLFPLTGHVASVATIPVCEGHVNCTKGHVPCEAEGQDARSNNPMQRKEYVLGPSRNLLSKLSPPPAPGGSTTFERPMRFCDVLFLSTMFSISRIEFHSSSLRRIIPVRKDKRPRPSVGGYFHGPTTPCGRCRHLSYISFCGCGLVRAVLFGLCAQI